MFTKTGGVQNPPKDPLTQSSSWLTLSEQLPQISSSLLPALLPRCDQALFLLRPDEPSASNFCFHRDR